jgi:hypothetical protein
MSFVRPSTEFSVDLDKREVHHKCGASVSFYEYIEAEDWLSAGGSVRNAYLFDGSAEEFLRLAKEAALAAGMPHERPPVS